MNEQNEIYWLIAAYVVSFLSLEALARVVCRIQRAFRKRRKATRRAAPKWKASASDELAFNVLWAKQFPTGSGSDDIILNATAAHAIADAVLAAGYRKKMKP